jgi:DNA-binding response OmpR family regulator
VRSSWGDLVKLEAKGEEGEDEKSSTILLVDHDPEIGGPIVEQLVADGYRTAFAHTAQHARALAANALPALVLLGRLDSLSGALELLADIRSGENPWRRHLPVIVLGSPARPVDLLRAFAAGADDFLARPAGWDQHGMGLDYLELRARMQSLLRRATLSGESALPSICVGPLRIDTSSRTVILHERSIRLRPREYALLLHLAQEPTRVFTKQDLLRALWGLQVPSYTRTLDSHACRLRGKLTRFSSEKWVVNVRSVGYRLTA